MTQFICNTDDNENLLENRFNPVMFSSSVSNEHLHHLLQSTDFLYSLVFNLTN